LLEVKNINVFYGDVQVLWDVSLRVSDGEIVTLIGANGAGKSTTLKTISGLLKPARGKITFMGNTIEGAPPDRIVELGIAQVPEARRLFPYMTVLENLEVGAYNKAARKYREETLRSVFDIFPILEERKHQLAVTLSGGEQQMLSIGRGLMSRPKLLMLDEPSLGLAPLVVEKTFETLRKINKQGISILLVEQNVYHAVNLASRGYVMESGHIVMEARGEELLSNEYVKQAYLGM
jgi:branched-chain amino acid transport system ATP-binding protein